MPRLIVLRHAKSDQHVGLPDLDRPLARRGQQQAPEAGRWLATHLGPIDLAVVSPAVRARETWALVDHELPSSPPVQLEGAVYNAALGDLLQVVEELPEEAATVLLVGHNPGVAELVAALTGDEVEMATAALAVVDLPAGWASVRPGAGILWAHGRPPVLD